MIRTDYVVVNENTLGYVTDANPSMVGVLAGSVLKGGPDPRNGPVLITPRDRVRPATVDDFQAYRVSARGHLEGR